MPCWLIVVGIDAPEGTIFDASRTERDTIRSERRKISLFELIQVDIAGIEIDESPAIKGGRVERS